MPWRVAGDVDQVLEPGDAIVEVVVAEGVDIEAHHSHHSYRRLLVEEARQRWRRSVRITGRERDRVGIVGSVGIPIGGQLGGPTERPLAEHEQRIELPMPVGHSQELDIDRLATTFRVRARRSGEHRCQECKDR